MVRRLILVIFLVVGMMGVSAAQEQPPTPAPDIEAAIMLAETAAAQAEAAAQQANAAIADLQNAEDRANQAIDQAFNLLGLFEAMSGAVGLVIPFLAIVAGLVGFRRLESAQSELREARERFERDVQKREIELDALREDLQATARAQREMASKSSLALSLLPVGERQYRAQDYTGALDSYKRALDLDPNNPITHYRMGYVYTQSGKFDEADYHLKQSLSLDPEFAPALASRGYVFRRIAEMMEAGTDRDIMYNEAEEHFLKALKALPKLMDEDGESWWGSLGGLYRRRGQIEQAIYAYERCTQVTPHSSYPFSNLALLYAQTHNRERMIETYKRVEQLAWKEVQAEVDNYWAYADLIASRLAQGKLKELNEVLEMGLRTAPIESPYTLDILIDTLKRLKDALLPEEHTTADKVIAYIDNFRQERERQRTALAI